MCDWLRVRPDQGEEKPSRLAALLQNLKLCNSQFSREASQNAKLTHNPNCSQHTLFPFLIVEKIGFKKNKTKQHFESIFENNSKELTKENWKIFGNKHVNVL